MLNRAVLPLLRPRSFQTASHLAFARCQIRGIRNDRGRLHEPGDFKAPSSSQSSADKYQQPLRAVPGNGQTYTAAEPQQPAPQRPSPPPPRPSPPNEDDTVEPTPSQPLPDLRDGIPSDYDPNAQPQKPLPDLTQGIPSTIDAELEGVRRGGRAPKNAPDQGEPTNTYVSSIDQRRSRLAKYFYIGLGLGSVFYGLYQGREFDEEEAKAHKDVPATGYGPGVIYQRAKARWGSTMSYYQDPVVKKMLPDPMEGYAPPYTLVVGLEDLLIHSEWSREHGWRIAKRPGMDYFLKYLSSYYEIVVFSDQQFFVVEQISRKLDPYRMFYQLAREHTSWEDGGYVKDLSYLNRDLKKVVMIDNNPQYVKKQPDNAIVLPKWNGDPNDKTLVNLIPFLENLANLDYPDVREVLKSFEGKDIAVEFDRRQKLLREKFQAQQAEKKRRSKSSYSLGSIFGGKSQQRADGTQSIREAEMEGKMYSDWIRERGIDMYRRLEKQLEIEGPKILAANEAEEKKAQEEAMASAKAGMFSWFGPGGKKEGS